MKSFLHGLLASLVLVLLATGSWAQTPQYIAGGGGTANSIPWGNQGWSDQRCQFLYRPGEFGTVPVGFITKIYWRAGSTQNGSTYANFRIDLGQNTTMSLTGNTWETGLTTVYTSPLEVINTTNGQWFSFTLQTPLFFDPALSLIADTRQTATTGGFTILYGGAVGNRRQYAASVAPNPAGSGTQRYDFGFDLIQGFPCTGTPTTTLEGPAEVCPKRNFTITFGTFYTGVTRQWQKSNDGNSWTNFTGTVDANTGAITDAVSVNTYYRCIITCIATGQKFITTPKLVKIAPFYYCYCTTGATATAGIDIGNVTVTALPSNTTLLNNGTATPIENNITANKGYSYFSQALPSVPIYPDSSYKFSVSQINSAAFVQGVAAIYIDCNRNGTFDDSERIFKANPANVLPAPGVVTLPSFQLPPWAEYGLTGMRVIIRGGNADPDTCGDYANGETEDYLVDLRYVPCDGKPDSARIEGDTSMCIGYKYVLTDTAYEKHRHGIERYWQLSADGMGWTDIPGSKNKDTLTRIFGGQPFYYRVQTVCTHTNDTTSGHPHKVNIKPTYKCYCHSQANGSAQDTSDIGAFTISTFTISDGGTHLLNPKAFRERQDHTDREPLQLDVDSIYQFSVFHTMPYNTHADGKITVFVDFNNNKKYDIPEERIFTGFTSIGYHVLLNALLIPDNVIVNVPTGLRVIINNDVAPNIPSDEACGEYFSGETEDYIVVFKRPFPESIQDAENINQLSLSPNPTSGKFQLQFKGGATASGVTVRILNITGQVVKHQVYPHSGGIFRQTIDLGNEAKGMYMVEVTASNGQKMVQRLTVK